MRRFQFSIRDLLLIIVIAALAAGWSADHQRLNRRLTAQQWDYLHTQINGLRGGMLPKDAAEEDELARIGLEGWEIIAVDRSASSVELWLKRPKK